MVYFLKHLQPTRSFNLAESQPWRTLWLVCTKTAHLLLSVML